MITPPTKKVLDFDFRYLFAYAAVLFFVDIAGEFLATFIRFALPAIVPSQDGGFSFAYLVAFPLQFLSYMVVTTACLLYISKLIEEKRAYMFRGVVSKKALLLEQIIPSGFFVLLATFAVMRSGAMKTPAANLGAFFCYITGIIGPDTLPSEVYSMDVGGYNMLTPYTYWVIPLCTLIIYLIWNALLYFMRLNSSINGAEKRSAETAELYLEHMNKKIK